MCRLPFSRPDAPPATRIAAPGMVRHPAAHTTRTEVGVGDTLLLRLVAQRLVAAATGGLSDEQLRDAFRAAGYGPDEVKSYTQELRQRIAELNKL